MKQRIKSCNKQSSPQQIYSVSNLENIIRTANLEYIIQKRNTDFKFDLGLLKIVSGCIQKNIPSLTLKTLSGLLTLNTLS